MDNTNDLV